HELVAARARHPEDLGRLGNRHGEPLHSTSPAPPAPRSTTDHVHSILCSRPEVAPRLAPDLPPGEFSLPTNAAAPYTPRMPATPGQAVFQLRVKLGEVTPTVWRRLLAATNVALQHVRCSPRRR